MNTRQIRRIQRAASPYMEPGEKVRRAAFGIGGRNAGGPVNLGIASRSPFVLIVATDRSVYVFRRHGAPGLPQIDGIRDQGLISSTPVTYSRGKLLVANARYTIPRPRMRADARHLVGWVQGLQKNMNFSQAPQWSWSHDVVPGAGAAASSPSPIAPSSPSKTGPVHAGASFAKPEPMMGRAVRWILVAVVAVAAVATVMAVAGR